MRSLKWLIEISDSSWIDERQFLTLFPKVYLARKKYPPFKFSRMHDQHDISYYNIETLSKKHVMRISKIISGQPGCRADVP